jgi:hypothetical protein
VLPVRLVFRDASAVRAMLLGAMSGSHSRGDAHGGADEPLRS